jgi:protein-disulfide isomerase
LEDYSDAISLGVQSTPTFFINDTQLVGAQPYETFQNMIEAELAKAGE